RPTGTELARGVRDGTVSATEAVDAALEAARNDPDNAFTSVDERAARPAGRAGGALAGVPIAVKDLIDHSGRITTAGSAFYRHAPDRTASALRRLEEEGAVVVGRTGLHEFAFGFSSENPWFGPVHNPWDSRLSPGGSSGGSAAAVAAGIVPIALGTDTGGSIRVPAALCAVTGLKVSHGLIPLDGVFPLVPSLDTVGVIAGSLLDLETATRIMAGSRWTEPAEESDPIRLVVPSQWVGSAPIDDLVATVFDRFIDGARDTGIEVTEADLADLVPSSLQGTLIGPEVEQVHGAWRKEGRPYGADVGARIDSALSVTEAEARSARDWRRVVTASMTRATSAGQLLITPTVPALDKVIGQERIGNHHYRAVLSWFTALVNTAGLPALSMPLRDGPGRPPSLQLIGAPGSEARLLSVARRLEREGLLEVPGRAGHHLGPWSSEGSSE
ncbi:MAG: amidase, partial [Acidimicrobiia bacterium]